MSKSTGAKAAAKTAAEPTSERLTALRDEIARRERAAHIPSLQTLVATAGMPAIWMRVLKAVVEAAGDAAPKLVAAAGPDSPGGKKITKAEVVKIAEEAAQQLRDALITEFLPSAE